uniref:Uncharacterized protein n=1 Tax=Rhizophora mucronata TaxID=61149 RepID=A0A2P2PXM6_RHIMU
MSFYFFPKFTFCISCIS